MGRDRGGRIVDPLPPVAGGGGGKVGFPIVIPKSRFSKSQQIRKIGFCGSSFHSRIDFRVHPLAIVVGHGFPNTGVATVVGQYQLRTQVEVGILPGDAGVQYRGNLYVGLADIPSRPFLDDVLERNILPGTFLDRVLSIEPFVCQSNAVIVFVQRVSIPWVLRLGGFDFLICQHQHSPRDGSNVDQPSLRSIPSAKLLILEFVNIELSQFRYINLKPRHLVLWPKYRFFDLIQAQYLERTI